MNELGRLERRSAALLCVAACWLLGCAEGYEGIEAIRQSAASGQPNGGGGTIAPRAGNGGAGGSTGGSSAGAAGAGTTPGATGAGMPCLRGETEVCTCTDKGTMGQMTCVFDAASPLDGFFSACSRCPDPAPMTSGPGDVSSNDAGTPMGGSGGSSASGGSGGSGGSAPPPPPPPPTTSSRTCASPCNQPCFPIGIIACCNPLGVCGCTWAPGGYCL